MRVRRGQRARWPWCPITHSTRRANTEHANPSAGRRFLLRQLASSVEIYLESGSADRPHFHSVVSDIRKVYADSPDTDYRRAHIQLKRGAVYRLYGNVPSSMRWARARARAARRTAGSSRILHPRVPSFAHPATLYYGVQLYRSKGDTGRNMSDEEIPRRPNGDFELFLTATPTDQLPVRSRSCLRRA